MNSKNPIQWACQEANTPHISRIKGYDSAKAAQKAAQTQMKYPKHQKNTPVTDDFVERAQAFFADTKLMEVARRWNNLPDTLKDGILAMTVSYRKDDNDAD